MDLKESSKAEIKSIDVNEARNLLNLGHFYIDVRSAEEFMNGHVENAFNIPYMFTTPKGRVKNPNFMDHILSTCSKEDHLVVGCQSGVRSVYATTDLLNAGFKHAYNMGGGYIAWTDSGFDVKKPNRNPPCALVEEQVKIKKPISSLNHCLGPGEQTVKITLNPTSIQGELKESDNHMSPPCFMVQL